MEYRPNVEQIQKNINNNTKYPFVEEKKNWTKFLWKSNSLRLLSKTTQQILALRNAILKDATDIKI